MYAKYEETSQQIRILRQLKDMFTTIPHWRLREVCKANNWNLESCIDQLMNSMATSGSCHIDDDKRYQQHGQQQQKIVGNTILTKDEERVGSLIKKGYRVMILMRGPPGCGKTHLSRSLITTFACLENNDYGIEDFVCSTDDYFYNAKGVYKYNPAYIPEAHKFNHQRVEDKAKSGLSPIIVDNTNIQIWEMIPYVKIAVQNNYLIEIIEPKTPWRSSPRTLAQKNTHGVSQSRIQQIIDKYEKCSVASLTKMLKTTKYTKTLPQMRLLPPLYTEPIDLEKGKLVQDTVQRNIPSKKEESQYWDSFQFNAPKEQRTNFKSSRSPAKSIDRDLSPAPSTRDVYSLLEEKTLNVWKPFESESADFWGIKRTRQQNDQSMNETDKVTGGEKSLLDLLRETTEDDAMKDDEKIQKNEMSIDSIAFERHSISCPYENKAFVALRQIYPNKRVSGLWDLFIKCNGDVDWAVDILLKEDELEKLRGDCNFNYETEDDEVFECSCNNPKEEIFEGVKKSSSRSKVENNFENFLSSLNTVNAKPQRQKNRFARSNQMTNSALLEVKENIENCFVLGDDQYSDHLLKIRNLRTGLHSDVTASPDATTEGCEDSGNPPENTLNENVDGDYIGVDDEGEDDNDLNEFNEDMLEISLGEQLVQQLIDNFKNESSLEDHISSNLPLNIKVFMPRTLAKQLYMLWVESAFNYMEEERQKLVQEDEDFARLLKNPKYAEYKQSPNNLREILDMEYAWNVYNQDKREQQEQDAEKRTPRDLASHLTQMKLCEAFPDIPSETLIDIMSMNENDYNATVAVLRSTMKNEDTNALVSTTQEHLMECARREHDLINQQVQQQVDQRQERVLNNWSDDKVRSSSTPVDAKRLALREFEESRNLAAHHCQLKAECYQKAKEAIQSGNGGAAIYYSQIANLHKKKIDMYNHRAANCIMDVHKYTQNNPDLLDLHYLHLIEALGCLDLFLDRHITSLRVTSKNYKHVFIITGRGKHSAGGVSTIKNKVKARLKERCLRWSEVNPGLLKVKIFSGSRHSKNI